MSARLEQVEWIWRDGKFVRWEDATVHVLSLAVQFGSSVFEGIRCYETSDRPAIFRLGEHIKRLRKSCRIYRIDLPYSDDELMQACVQAVAKNNLKDCYVRPMVIRGYGAAGLNPEGSPIETFVPCWPWGTYLGPEALEQGVDVCISSWQRMQPNTYPAAAKAAGHYVNAQLIKMEALTNGYVEAIVLGPGGVVSEGSGQNVFAVVDGTLVTPSVDGTSLQGITAASVMTIADDLGIPLRREVMPRESLYGADELFFTGTASEVTPIRSVDRIVVGEGKMGPVTRKIQEHFLGVVRGEIADAHGWLTAVN